MPMPSPLCKILPNLFLAILNIIFIALQINHPTIFLSFPGPREMALWVKAPVMQA